MPGQRPHRWLEQREQELLPTRYVHAVFTLPRELAPLALQNKRLIYGLLFRTSAATLLEVARGPQHLGAEIGFFSVLHTWDQRLQHHPHVHCVIAAGGLAPDHSSWISSRRSFFLPVKVLGRVFRGKFVAGLKTAFREGKLEFHGKLAPLAQPRSFAAWLRLLFHDDWIVYSKRPSGGPEHALRYLGTYTHRVGIANSRLVALCEGNVSFRWRDSAHGNKKRIMTLPVDEFLRRFLLHLLPRLRPHPQLRLPRQPATRHIAPALLQIAQPSTRFSSPDVSSPAIADPSEVPALRRNDARHRATHRGPTVAALPTLHRSARRVIPQPQPRTGPILPHAQAACAFSNFDRLKLRLLPHSRITPQHIPFHEHMPRPRSSHPNPGLPALQKQLTRIQHP
jgi:hypothetical protein